MIQRTVGVREDAAPAWDLHLRPNAFGLQIARYPAEWELTATAGRLRGGDSGTSLQTEVFIQRLTLASSFEIRWDKDADTAMNWAVMRWAYPLEDVLTN